jgi:hypothetical protein
VLPLWGNNVVGRFADTEIKSMIDLAKGYLQNTISYDFAYKKLLDEYHPFAGHLYIATDIEVPYFAKKACNAAYEALAITLGAEPFDGFTNSKLASNVSNENFEPIGDSASAAVTAFVNYGTSMTNPSLKIRRRREFWEWWLLDAIPQAWDLAHRYKL